MNILLAKGVLPNSTSVLPHHGLALLAAECFLEFRHVGNHSVHPGLRRRVRIRLCHHAQVLGSRVRTPSFSIRNEESLLRVNPFLSGRLSFSERVLSRAINAIRNPPLSAVFSPSVNLPFSFMPSAASKPEYSSAMHCALRSNSLPSSAVHQS